jgi:hypothetical protein
MKKAKKLRREQELQDRRSALRDEHAWWQEYSSHD